LFGFVPFPKDIVLQFPAWADVARTGPARSFAEIGDLVTFCYPFRQILAQSIREGSLPLWNPYFLSGESFLGNSQSALFYPLNVFYYFLPAFAAWTVNLVLRRILAGVFMALFMRSIGASRNGALLSGIIFSCCAFTTVWQGQAAGDAAIWLPLVCYAVNRLRSNVSGRSLAIAAFAFAAPVLAGHPETAFNVTLVGLTLAAFLFVPAPDLKFAAYFTAAGVLALGLASIQMLPTLEWIRHVGDSLNEAWPALETWQLKGWVSRDILRNPNSSGIFIPEAASYAGIVSLLIAPLALWHQSRWYVRFLIFITLLATAVAFSVEPLRWVVAHTPFIKALRNGRLILVADFGVAALAGFGLSVFEHFVRRRLLSWLVIAIAALDLATFSYGYIGFARPSEIFPKTAVFEFLQQQTRPARYRVAQLGFPFPMNSGVMYGIESMDGYEVSMERTRKFTRDFSEDRMDGMFLVTDKVIHNQDRRIDMLNAKYFVVPSNGPDFQALSQRPDRFSVVFDDKHVAVFENRNVLPRAFLVSAAGVEIVQVEESQLARIRDPGFNPVRSVVLSVMPASLVGSKVAADVPFNSRVETVTSSTSSYSFRTHASQPAVLVVSQMFYPGWKAFVDGRETQTLTADYGLMGIAIPAGDHQVDAVFRPRSFTIGAILSVLSVLALVGLCAPSRVAAKERSHG